MHELSIVRTLLREVELIAAAELGDVVEIHLGCGELSGYEPECLRTAFAQLQGPGRLEYARLVIHPIPLAAVCEQCSGEFEPADFRRACPQCGSPHTHFARGTELWLESIVLDETRKATVP
ncbi:MAG: hydrogenase maturation nickel metallochaperone HypA [Planctomycetaceae bacterium]|nr:hydrogenase maturation nickel metallochaperone HypA [Planctomycetaceae bacterium]